MSTQRIRLVHMTTVPYALFYVTGQVGYMKRRGFDVYALSSPGGLLSQFSKQEDVPVKAVDMERRITPFRDLQALFRIWRWFRQIRPTIIHAHTPKGGLLGMLAGWLAGVPVRIYHLHGLRFVTVTGWKRRLLIVTERWACRLAQQVLCVSASVEALARDAGLCPPEKIKVLLQGSCNGVDATQRFNPAHVPPASREEVWARFGIPADAFVLGFVGRIVWSKGVVELVEAWKTLREEFPNLHMLMVGPIEPEDPLPAEVEAALRNDSRIHLVGQDWDTPPLFASMDVLVLPTYREGLPIVLLEAAAMTLPSIGTRVPGCVDVIEDGVTGTLLPPYDAPALASAVRAYIRDPELRRRHGLQARQRVLRDFQQETIWRALYQEYLRCLQAMDMPPPIRESASRLPPSDLAGRLSR